MQKIIRFMDSKGDSKILNKVLEALFFIWKLLVRKPLTITVDQFSSLAFQAKVPMLISESWSK